MKSQCERCCNDLVKGGERLRMSLLMEVNRFYGMTKRRSYVDCGFSRVMGNVQV